MTDDKTTNDAVVAEAKSRFELCTKVDDGNRALSLEDLRFLKGDQWDAQAVAQRNLDNRPCLTFNNLPSILHQVTNDVRQNKQSIQVHPVDDDADVEVAEVLEGLIRHIEYDSGADAAYDTALDGAASIGFGFFRLVTEYCDPLSFDQDMKIKRVRNPFTVFVDPSAQEADSSDMQWAIISSKVPSEEFKREYPKAETTTEALGRSIGNNGNWLADDYVRVAEYYRIEYKSETLVLMTDGSTMLASDKRIPPPGVTPQATRPTFTHKVMWYKLTAYEVLEKAEVPCKWIPIYPVYGDEIDIDGEVTRSGLIRNAKSPKQMENYWLTSATEEIALRTKTPFIGAMGQFEGVEDDWNAANVRNFSYLEYNPVTVDGNLAPAPQRQAPADVPGGYIAMAGIARDAVKATTGIYDASLGNRSNEVSGLAIRARQQQGDIANFHFSDNLQRAIKHLARCMIDMIPKIYDTERVARVLGIDGKADKVVVNQPNPNPKPDPETGAIKTVLNDLTVGTYDVVVTTGPAYNTLREEAAANMIELGGKWPKLMDVAGDKVIRAMDWPDAEGIADRVAKSMPPGLVDDDGEEQMVQTPKGPIPVKQAGQMIGQMDQAMEAMHAHLEEMQAGITKANLDNASKERIASEGNAAKLDVEELKGMIQLLLAGQAPMIAHQAAVVAAADPAHPDAPAPIAQGIEQAPAAVAEQEAASAPPQGNEA